MGIGGGILIFGLGMVVGALLLTFLSSTVIGAPLFNTGENRVSSLLRRNLERPDYFIIENVTRSSETDEYHRNYRAKRFGGK